MRSIIRIARVELSNLFYSPIAWVLLIIFLIQVGLAYVMRLENAVTVQEIGGRRLEFVEFLTNQIFSTTFGAGGIFQALLNNLYLYMPLLTMGLMSRETSSGTIKLLYSSPIKTTEIILGKFLAMMGFNLVMVAVIGIPVSFGVFNIVSIDFPLILSGLLAIYLLLCTYAAIGLFLSCLTSYQVVAAIGTFAVFAMVRYVGTLWQQYDVLRDITDFLAINGRTEVMIMGLIRTSDVLYYVIIIAVFLAFGILKLHGDRTVVPRAKQWGSYVGIVLVAMAVGYVTSLPTFKGFWDVTRNQAMTITPNTQKIIKALGSEPLEIITYSNFLDYTYSRAGIGSQKYLEKRWELYTRFKPDIKLDYVFYYDSIERNSLYKSNEGKTLAQIAEKQAKARKLNFNRLTSPEELRKTVDLRPEGNRLVMQLKFGGRSTFLRTFDDQVFWPLEAEIAAALKRLTVTPPKIAFLQDELERSIDRRADRDYRSVANEHNFRNALINQGFEVEQRSLSENGVPDDVAVLVIADPRVPFDPATIRNIQKYIAGGGNLLVAGEPGKQAILNPILAPLGVNLMEGTLIQQSKDYAPDLVLPMMTPLSAGFTKTLSYFSKDSIPVSMPSAAGLSVVADSGFNMTPLLVTDGRYTWNKLGSFVIDSAAIVFSAADGDERMAVPTAVALTRTVAGKEQRIFIAGDADFLSNIELGRYNPRIANQFFNLGLMSWFTGGEFPVDVTRPLSIDKRVNVTGDGVFWIRVALIWVIPGLLLIFGSVLLIRRKRK